MIRSYQTSHFFAMEAQKRMNCTTCTAVQADPVSSHPAKIFNENWCEFRLIYKNCVDLVQQSLHGGIITHFNNVPLSLLQIAEKELKVIWIPMYIKQQTSRVFLESAKKYETLNTTISRDYEYYSGRWQGNEMNNYLLKMI